MSMLGMCSEISIKFNDNFINLSELCNKRRPSTYLICVPGYNSWKIYTQEGRCSLKVRKGIFNPQGTE